MMAVMNGESTPSKHVSQRIALPRAPRRARLVFASVPIGVTPRALLLPRRLCPGDRDEEAWPCAS